jgi:putative OmpL-like beta-barrel porin-2
MKTVLKAFGVLAAVALVASPVRINAQTTDAKDQKDLKKVIEDQGINYVETAQKGITLSGYVDTSYTEQFGGRGDGFGGTQALDHQFDVHNDNFNVNAVKIALEKALPDKNEWAAGFRIDTMYGSDASILSAADPGLGASSEFYLEQALVKFRIPVGNGLDIYAGKFTTFLGYEVIESPANLNFSRGLLFTDAIPLTNTGVYADYKFNSTFEAKLAVVDGWNSSVSSPNGGGGAGSTDAQNDYPFGGKAIMGQLNINAPGGNANITQSFIYSPSGEPNNNTAFVNNTAFGRGTTQAGDDNGPVAVYDIWGNWNPTFVKDSALLLGFNVDFGYNGASGEPAQTITPGVAGAAATNTLVGAVNDSNTWYGVALYASYKLTKVVTLSARGEYLHEDASDAPKFGIVGVDQDDFSETLTATFNIWDNLLTRVEYRFDNVANGQTNANPFTSRNNVATYQSQNEISLEAVYSF